MISSRAFRNCVRTRGTERFRSRLSYYTVVEFHETIAGGPLSFDDSAVESAVQSCREMKQLLATNRLG
jgi:hypothetical protein